MPCQHRTLSCVGFDGYTKDITYRCSWCNNAYFTQKYLEEQKKKVIKLVNVRAEGFMAEFLSAKNYKVGQKLKIKFVDGGETKETDFGKRMEIEVETSGMNYKMSLSNATIKAVAKTLGEESNSWINQEVEFVVVKSKMGNYFQLVEQEIEEGGD